MDKRGKRQAASIFGGMGFYIALLVCVFAAGVVGYYALLNNDEEIPPVVDDPLTADQTESGIVTNANDETGDSAQQVSSNESVVIPQPIVKPDLPEKDAVDPPQTEEETPVSGGADIPETPPVQEDPVQITPVVSKIVSPLAGRTVSVFSADRLMYDATLDDWRTHDGIDISADAGTQVVSAAAGTVLSVGEDDRLGVNIRIEHANGYVTTYASLHPETFVSVGDKVEAGDVIGTVGNTSLTEAALGAHLHFSVTKNGELIDPAAYLPKEE